MTDAHHGSPTVPPEPWRWLIDLREHLVAALEIVTTAGEPLLPGGRGDTADRLRRLLRPRLHAAVAALIRDAVQTGSAQAGHADGLRVLALRFDRRHDPAGCYVLLLSERGDAGREAPRRADLARVASWLTHALSSTSPTSVRDWHQLTVLHRILRMAIGDGSQLQLMRAYVEALAIWTDTDTRVYQANQAGRYVLEVCLAGADRARMPRSLPVDAVGAIQHRRRLPPAEAAYYGFTTAADIIAAPVPPTGLAAWLVVYAGRLSAATEERIALFEAMLGPALRLAGEVETARLVWRMMQSLTDAALPAGEAAARALGELEQATLAMAAFRATSASGVLLDVGSPLPVGPRAATWPAAAVQRLPVPMAGARDAILTLWRPPDHPFTQREARLARTGAALLAKWLTSTMGTRTTTTAADATSIDRRHDDALASDVSMLVILPEPVDTARDVQASWVDDLRAALRSADVVGSVATGDISVLLPRTSEHGARHVASRLSRLFSHRTSLALLDGAAIAVVSSRSAGSR